MSRSSRSNSQSSSDDVLTKSALEAFMARLERKFDDQKKEFNDALNSAVDKLNSNFCDKINSVNQRMDDIQYALDDNNRILRFKEVIINGIPVLSNENPMQIFDKISSSIGFNRQCCYAVDNIFRLGKSKQSIRPPLINAAPILVRFSTQLLKNEFIQLYFKHGNLNLMDIGFSNCSDGDRVFINHNLSKTCNEIHKAARKLKKCGKINKIQIKSGFVFVVWHGASSLVRITTIEELQTGTSTLE